MRAGGGSIKKKAKLPAFLMAILALAPLLGGCGDHSELPDKAFVMGVAIDEAKEGGILMTFQIYKPSQKIGQSGKTEHPYINIKTTDKSVMQAIRDVTIHLGRKAQFSHMRVILIGDNLARKVKMSKLLDMFYRDHEPRLTCSVIITKGPAGPYFGNPPFIESTVSQQYYLSEKTDSNYSAKAVEADLLTLALQMRSETKTAALPYMSRSGGELGNEPGVAGTAIFKDGLMIDHITGHVSEGLLMLKNEYHSGVIDVPCSRSGDPSDSFSDESLEVLSFKAKRKIDASGSSIRVSYRVKVYVAAIELSCTNLSSEQKETEFEEKIAAEVDSRMRTTLSRLRKDKTDLLNIGNSLYERHPRLWKKLKPVWQEKFTDIQFAIDTKAILVTHGTTKGKALLESKD